MFNYPRNLNKNHHILQVEWVSSSWGNVTVFLYSIAAHEKELGGRVKNIQEILVLKKRKKKMKHKKVFWPQTWGCNKGFKGGHSV